MPVLRVVLDNVDSVLDSIRGLSQMQVLVGIPESADHRKEGKAGNALIGWVHEHGIPSRNLPARPHLVPGVMAVQHESIEGLKRAAQYALDGDKTSMVKQLSAVGQRGVSSVKSIIRQKIPPPLAERTVAARLARTKSGQRRLKRMRGQQTDLVAWGAQNLTPLIDTSDYIQHITFVVRDRGTGSELKGI